MNIIRSCGAYNIVLVIFIVDGNVFLLFCLVCYRRSSLIRKPKGKGCMSVLWSWSYRGSVAKWESTQYKCKI